MKYAKVLSGVVREAQEFDTDPGADWIACEIVGPGWVYSGGVFKPPASTLVPSEITMRQARLVLDAANLIDPIDATIAAIADPAKKRQAKIEWEYSNTVQRHNGFVSLLAPALGLSEAQIDAMFVAGVAL